MKSGIFFILTILCLISAGCSGPEGEAGNNVPGGTMAITEYGGADPDTRVVIAFDPDEIADSGNETLVVYPMAGYLDGVQINITLSWSAPNVVPGTYYVYAWIDFTGNTLLNDEGFAADEVFVFDYTSDYAYDEVDRIESNNLNLSPNYTFWEDFAPDIDFAL